MAHLQKPDEEGVSEVVGSVLLIALVVLAVAIVGVTLFSQPHVAEVPHASIVAGNSSNGTFVLFHEGGDPLTEGEYRIYVDNGSGLEDRTDAFTLEGDDLWSIGEALTYTGQGTPERVVVLAVDTGGGESVIAEPFYRRGTVDAGVYVDAGGSGTVPTVRPTTITTTTTTTIPTTPHPETVHDITMITRPPTNGVIEDGGTFTFTVTDPWFPILIGDNYLALSPDDRVEITLIGEQKGTLGVMGGTITDFDFHKVQVSVNDEHLGEGAIEIGSCGYDNLASTLTLSVKHMNARTFLEIDDNLIIPENKDGIVLKNLVPDSMGMMYLEFTGGGHADKSISYYGGAEDYTLSSDPSA